LTEDQEREAFEKACVVKFAMWRAEGNKLNDNGCPTTRESLCWRDEQGNYGVAMLNAAWWGWRSRARHATGPAYPRCPICKDDSAACPKSYSGGNVGPPCPF
jgi:hypothetical protein